MKLATRRKPTHRSLKLTHNGWMQNAKRKAIGKMKITYKYDRFVAHTLTGKWHPLRRAKFFKNLAVLENQRKVSQ